MTDRTQHNTVLCYITAGDRESALRIGQDLVEQRLAACVNILGEMTSIYRWDDAIQTDPEVALLAKTQAHLVDRLSARVVDTHGYACPCVVALPMVGGHPPFLAWIASETEPTAEDTH
ncbi:MAG: divalent-cation tolerance protein CutA [Geminicoccaceae bacterium]